MCHASEDKQAVTAVYYRLKKEGFNPWLDKENLLPGQIWAEEIPKAIRAADFALVFLSTSSVYKRGYVQKEFKIVLDVLDEIPEGRVFVIPVKLDNCEVPERFSQLHWSNLYEEGSLERIIESIKRHIAHTGLVRSSLQAAREPLETTLERARETIETLEARLFEVPIELVDKYKNFLDDKSAGITRILPQDKYERLLGIAHGGAWYSFSRRTHDAHNEAEIALAKERSGYALNVGFKGLHYGFFLPLGDVPIVSISSSQKPPQSLHQSYHLAWSYIWSYKPPAEVKKLRIEGYKFGTLGGVRIGDINLGQVAPIQPRSTYLLRSINHRVSDLLVALRVEKRLEDDSVILLWRILAEHEVPDDNGPEPHGFDLADTLADEILSGSSETSIVSSSFEGKKIEQLVEALHPQALRLLKKLYDEEMRGHIGKTCNVGTLVEHSQEIVMLQEKGLAVFWPRVHTPNDMTERTFCFLTTAGSTFLEQLERLD